MGLMTKVTKPPGVAFQRKLDFAVTPQMVALELTRTLKSMGVLSRNSARTVPSGHPSGCIPTIRRIVVSGMERVSHLIGRLKTFMPMASRTLLLWNVSSRCVRTT